jgi:hypothetical protein
MSAIAPEKDSGDERKLDFERAAGSAGRSAFRDWLAQDSPYIAMLLLALAGVIFRLPVGYWVVLAPVFGVICVVVGWRRFETREARLELLYTQALSWLALILAIYALYSYGVQGVLNTIATPLVMLTMLALGTFVAGVQVRVWRISAVGAVLFLAVPGIGWLKQSAPLLAIATLAIIAIGGLTWWVANRRHSGA